MPVPFDASIERLEYLHRGIDDSSGFSAAFFDEYHKHHPRSGPYYDQRQKLYELYHHLNVRLSIPLIYAVPNGKLRVSR